jgi:hypothetical protein
MTAVVLLSPVIALVLVMVLQSIEQWALRDDARHRPSPRPPDRSPGVKPLIT